MSQIQLYDTLTRSLRELPRPLEGKSFGMYLCGPTVYGPAHIGNFRTMLTLDVLYRSLKALGYPVKFVRNITDVDDKTIRGSRASGQSLEAFTGEWTRKFHEDCSALNMLSPDVEPRATTHIREQVQLAESLLAKGHAYVGGDGSVYFRVNSFSAYGQLSHFDREALRTQETNSAGALNLSDEYERDSVADFALWKAYKPEDGDVCWEGPKDPATGKAIRGRPGWHLECSAKSHTHLGQEFDLHAGGEDLIFPHHENEIAQSCCGYGGSFARHWMHVVHLLVEGKKMSKSLGNFYTLRDLVARGHSPMTVRYALISGHYRQQLNFTLHSLDAAASALRKLESFLRAQLELAGMEMAEFRNLWQQVPLTDADLAVRKLCDDLNVPAALGMLFSSLRDSKPDIDRAARVAQVLTPLSRLFFALGLDFADSNQDACPGIPAEVQDLAEARWQAKCGRNWAEADQLRAQLTQLGWSVLDRKDGYTLEPMAPKS